MNVPDLRSSLVQKLRPTGDSLKSFRTARAECLRFQSSLSDDQIHALVTYVRSLHTKEVVSPRHVLLSGGQCAGFFSTSRASHRMTKKINPGKKMQTIRIFWRFAQSRSRELPAFRGADFSASQPLPCF